MAGSLLLNSSCSDWLDLLPKNEQVTDAYWKSKEDVDYSTKSLDTWLLELTNNNR